MIGKVYGIPPQPHVPEDTRMLPAGVVTFGVEYRNLDADEGVSIHVFGTEDRHEYVRLDVFDGEPHYHYVHPFIEGREIVNNVIDFDTAAHGDMLP